jgi:hypothetical protein
VPVTVRRELIKHIIGKAGSNVQRLVNTYSITLLRPHAEESTASEQLVIEGASQESAAACAADIAAMAERYTQQLQRAATVSNTAAGVSPLLTSQLSSSQQQPPQQQQQQATAAAVQRSKGGLVRAPVRVPNGAMGYIVGKQRCTLHTLQSKYCVQIVRPGRQCQAADDGDGASQVLYVQSKDADSVQACVTRINAMLIERQSAAGHTASVHTSTGEAPVLTSSLTQLLLQQPTAAPQQQQQQQQSSTAAVQQQQHFLSAAAAPDGTRVCIAVHVPRALVSRITNRAVTLYKQHCVNLLRPNASAAAAAAGAVEVLGIAAPTVQHAEAGIAAIELTLAEHLQGGKLHRGGAPCVYIQGGTGASLMLASLQQHQQQLLQNESHDGSSPSDDAASVEEAGTAVRQHEQQQQQYCSESVAVGDAQTTAAGQDSDCTDSTLRPILGFNELMRRFRAAGGLTRQRLTKYVH